MDQLVHLYLPTLGLMQVEEQVKECILFHIHLVIQNLLVELLWVKVPPREVAVVEVRLDHQGLDHQLQELEHLVRL